MVKKNHLPARKNFAKWAAHPKMHGPGGYTTGFEDPCRTLIITGDPEAAAQRLFWTTDYRQCSDV